MAEVQEQEGESKSIALGEWFKPQLLEEVTERKAMLKRSTIVNVEKAGKVNISLTWDQKGLQRLRDLGFGLPLLFILPTGEKEIADDIIAMQELTETRAMSITIHSGSEEQDMNTLPYEAELQLPSGRVVTRDLIGKNAQLKKLVPWRDKESKKPFLGVFIPDASNLIDQLEIRINRTQTN